MTTNTCPQMLIRIESLARQLRFPLDTEEEGFSLRVRAVSFRVRFPYSTTLNLIARTVPNALWIKADREWSWPLEHYAAVRAARDQIIQTQRALWEARESLVSEIFFDNPNATIRSASARNVGCIVGKNEFLVAQKNGASLFVLHEIAALSSTVTVGETRSISYFSGHGVVMPIGEGELG